MRRTFFAFLVLGAAAHPVAAQALPDPAQALPDSARLRITAPRVSPTRPLIGTLQQADEWGIVLREEREGAIMNIPADMIVLAEMSRGRESASDGSLRGMGTGALVGSLLGATAAFMWAVTNNNAVHDGDGPSSDQVGVAGTSAMGVVMGGIPGALIGSVIGHAKPERWQRVRLPLFVAEREDGAVSVSVRFTQ